MTAELNEILQYCQYTKDQAGTTKLSLNDASGVVWALGELLFFILLVL